MKNPKRPIRTIACVGEVMIELRPTGTDEFKAGVAGDTYNTAVYLSRALQGTNVEISYVTALGAEKFSDRIIADARGHGLVTDMIERRPDRMPGLYAIQTDPDGERSFSYWRDASAARTLFGSQRSITLDRLNRFDLVVFSGISMAILPADIREKVLVWAANFVRNGGTLAYDSNHRPLLWENVTAARNINKTMWRLTDIALPSVDDEMELFGDKSEAAVVERLRAFGVTRGALKRGANGPLDLATGQSLQAVKVEKVVDSTAAGDSFNAGFLAAHAQGKGDIDAAHAGHHLAAQVIGFPGAIAPRTIE